MKRTYEICEIRGGTVLLAILNDGKCIEVISGWEDKPNSLLSALSGLTWNRDAWKDWKMDRVSDFTDIHGGTVEDFYKDVFIEGNRYVSKFATMDDNGRLNIDMNYFIAEKVLGIRYDWDGGKED